MNKIVLSFLSLLLLIFVFCGIIFVHSASAQIKYEPLVPIPEVNEVITGADVGAGPQGSEGVKVLIGNVFAFGIGLCAALAVIMIIYGGFLYVTREGFSQTSKAKEVIQNAVYGLIMALCIVIILRAVNASLLSGDLFKDLSIQNVTLENTFVAILPGQPGYPLVPGQPGYGLPFIPPIANIPSETSGLATEDAARSTLASSGIGVNKGACPSGTDYQNVSGGCTSVGGLPQYAVDDLIKLKQQCNCDITVTAGTEGGHIEHGDGKPVVDLAYSDGLNAYLKASNGRVSNSLGTFTYESPGGNARGTSTGNHWHTVLTNGGGGSGG